MQGHAVGANFGEVVDGVDGIERFTNFNPEGVASRVADRPEAEREMVFGCRFVSRCHGEVTFIGARLVGNPKNET